MARSRNIKPGLFKNEMLAECSIWARYLFPGLWTIADREGRLEDRPKRIKADLVPFDDQNVDALLDELASRGFISRYVEDGIKIIQIIKFKDHQNPHIKEQPSRLPACTGHAPDIHRTCTSKGNPMSGTCRASSLIPSSLIPLGEPNGSLSGKPDVLPRENGNGKEKNDQAREVLAFLNKVTGRNYRAVDANMKLARARLAEVPIDRIKQVIAMKADEWRSDAKMAEYLRPETLLGATKFAQYEGQLPKEGY